MGAAWHDGAVSTVPRTRAPELSGRGWLGVEGALRLADLRGRFVLLDFWTFCCINCLHVIDELRPVEEALAEDLVVIGVHSPKFAHEADPVALADAVRRYQVEHPVLDDPELRTWQAYAARAWPTLVLIDPEGYVVAHYAGEGHGHAIEAMVRELRSSYELSGEGRLARVAHEDTGALAYPAKAVAMADGSLLVADAGHHRLTRITAGGSLLGTLAEGELRQPQGLCPLPDDVATRLSYDVVVADTGHHRVLGVDSATGATTVVADELTSPWDVAWWRDALWIAMAGDHTLVRVDPRTGTSSRAAGTTHEGLVDGPPAEAWFAQPSALAPDGDRMWVVDAETSALRWLDAEGVHTAVGEGLFDFGFRDGDRAQARLQHPLGVTAIDGAVLVADTYNGAIRRYDIATGVLTTVARDLAEPTAILTAATGGEGERDDVLVVESAAHRLVSITLAEEVVEGPVTSTQRPVTEIAPGEVVLRVSFEPPPGQKVDERFGPAVQLHVSATPDALLRSGAGVEPSLTRRLEVDPSVGDGVLHVAARAASCDIDGGEGAACRLHQQDWGIPVRVSADGVAEIVLPLGGTP